MMHLLNNEEKIKISKLRLDNPYKLLWIWLFNFDVVMKEFENVADIDMKWNWRSIGSIGLRVLFLIPIYVIVAIWKLAEICGWYYMDHSFEWVCCMLIFIVFGVVRLPYAIYTYMRFNRATALMYMLKSD